MALGTRLVADLLAEISFHLIEPITVQTLTASLDAGPAVTITLDPTSSLTFPAAPLPPTSYLYPGAQVVLGWQAASAEVVTVIAVVSETEFTANLVNNHTAGETLFGATFPTQQPTDPIFTQSEILGYVAQAQNEFLTKTPLIFEFFPSNLIELGQTNQLLPGTAIELERVSVQSNPSSTSFNIASIARVGNVVTATLSQSVSSDQWTAQLPIQVYGVADSSFNTANGSTIDPTNATVLLATVSVDGLTLTWPQSGADSASSGGYVSRFVFTRLYESSQEQLSMNQPWWSSQPGLPPTQWYEDRTGIYGWGVAPPPSGNFYMDLICSVRATEDLTLLDNFLLPDIFIPYVKYKTLEYCFTKDGVQRSPSMARYCKGRYDFGVMLADRFLRNVIEKSGRAGAAAGGNF